jgi:peptidyl-dipeptidase A
MMGELLASQLHHAICRELYAGAGPASVAYAGDRRAGEFLTTRVFAPGRTLRWGELARHATGEELSARCFARDILDRQ